VFLLLGYLAGIGLLIRDYLVQSRSTPPAILGVESAPEEVASGR
jgi:hypothetical protein